MIERDSFDRDIFEVACDYCAEDEEFNCHGDWTTLMLLLKEKGWKYQKINDEWKHKCPACVEATK